MKQTIKAVLALMVGTMVTIACSDNVPALEDISHTPTLGSSDVSAITFTATQQSDGETRAAIGTSVGGKTSIDWQSTDKLSVFDGTSNKEFSLESFNSTDHTSATFTGQAAVVSTYTALSPYQSGATLAADGKITGVTLPATQTATAGSFDPATALMIAKATDGSKNFAFLNAVSYLKFTAGIDCKSVSIADNADGRQMAGTISMEYSESSPTCTVTGNGSSTVTLSGSLTAGTTYYLAVLPQTLKKGFTITMTTQNDELIERKYIQTFTIQPNKVINMGVFDRPATWSKNLFKLASNIQLDKKKQVKRIEIQTNCTDLPTTEVESNTIKLNDDGTLWQVWDGTETSPMYIRTSKSYIKMAGKICDHLFAWFENLETITGLNKLDMSEATSLFCMFMHCFKLQSLDLTSWDVSNVENMNTLFAECSSLTSLDLSTWDVSKVRYMNNMFSLTLGLTKIILSNNFSVAANHTSMFKYTGWYGVCFILGVTDDSLKRNLKNGTGELAHISFPGDGVGDVLYWLPDDNTKGYINSINFVINQTAPHGITETCYWYTGTGYETTSQTRTVYTNADKFELPTDVHEVFRNYTLLTTLDLSTFDASNVRNMQKMFYDCNHLISLTLNDTFIGVGDEVERDLMFNGCGSESWFDEDQNEHKGCTIYGVNSNELKEKLKDGITYWESDRLHFYGE